MLLTAGFNDLGPKTFVLTAGVSAVIASVPWATAYVILADTNWPDVVLELVKTVAMIATGIFAVLAANRAGRAETKANEAGEKVDTAAESLGTAATLAATEAQKASLRAKVAVQQVVENEKRAERGREVLAQVASHTNGEFAALKAENAELRKWKEAQLAAAVPPAVVEKIDHLTEVVEEVVETSKSGTKLGKAARDPNARERATDQPN
jgi:hypothetical protein